MEKIKRKNGAIKEGFSPLTIVMAVILGLYCLVLAIWLVWALLTSFKNPNDFLGNKYGLPNPWYFDIRFSKMEKPKIFLKRAQSAH